MYEHSWSFLPAGHSKTFGIGNYEYPFDVQLPGNIPETVEGVEGGQVSYRLKAVVERPGFAQNLVKRRILRVLRAISPDAVEMSQTMVGAR